MAENRLDRSKETRANTTQKAAWVQPDLLPTPTPRDGVAYHWVRVSTLGQNDPGNVSSKMREGWTPEKASDHPEMQIMHSENERFKDNVVIGGLMLCSAPVEMVEARNKHFQQMTNSQMESVDNNLMRENDPRMPLFNQRKTQVKFGKGT